MKKTIFFGLLVGLTMLFSCQSASKTNVKAVISTEMGDIKVQLFDETPIHRDNFIRQTENGYFDGLSFNKFMSNYMIEANDEQTGQGYGKKNTVKKQFNPLAPEIGQLHFKGALAAPRLNDGDRPSDGDRFYIITGRTNITDAQLNMQQQKYNLTYSPADLKQYKEQGGYPWLDGDNTVFGKVIEGLEVVMQIEKTGSAKGNVPISVKIVE